MRRRSGGSSLCVIGTCWRSSRAGLDPRVGILLEGDTAFRPQVESARAQVVEVEASFIELADHVVGNPLEVEASLALDTVEFVATRSSTIGQSWDAEVSTI